MRISFLDKLYRAFAPYNDRLMKSSAVAKALKKDFYWTTIAFFRKHNFEYDMFLEFYPDEMTREMNLQDLNVEFLELFQPGKVFSDQIFETPDFDILAFLSENREEYFTFMRNLEGNLLALSKKNFGRQFYKDFYGDTKNRTVTYAGFEKLMNQKWNALPLAKKMSYLRKDNTFCKSCKPFMVSKYL